MNSYDPHAFFPPPPPDGFVRRALYEDVVAALLDQEAPFPVFISSRMSDSGGFGKTTLAQAVAHDPRIRGAFDDVFWIRLGRDHVDVRGIIIHLYHILEGPPIMTAFPPDAEQEMFATMLAGWIEGGRYLFVLDDAWDMDDLLPLIGLGTYSAYLITTPNPQIPKRFRAEPFEVEDMHEEESAALLRHYMDVSFEDDEALRALGRRLGNWPLALNIIGKQLLKWQERHGYLHNEALQTVNERLDGRGIRYIEAWRPEDREEALGKLIEIVLEELDSDHRQRCLETAAFPEDTAIPVTAAARLWGDSVNVDQMIHWMAHFSLIQYDGISKTFRVPRPIRAYFRRALYDTRSVHTRLVQGYEDALPAEDRPVEAFTEGWGSGPDDGYYFQWLPYHMRRAGRLDTLRGLLMDYRWLYAALHAIEDPRAVLPEDISSGDIRLLRSALELSTIALRDDVSQFASQITGRLLGHDAPRIRALLEDAIEHHPEPWLRPILPSLRPVSGAALLSIDAHSRAINAVAVTPDGWGAVTASDDGTLRTWNLGTTEKDPVHLLGGAGGHTGDVNGVAITADGRLAISASDDKTLKVWDLYDGQMLYTLTGHTGTVNAVTACVRGPNGERHCVASVSDDGTLRLWDARRGTLIETLKIHGGWLLSVAVTTDGRFAVIGADDRTIHIWDLREKKVIHVLEGHLSWVRAVAISRDGRRILSGSDDGQVRIWDLNRGVFWGALGKHKGWVRGVDFTPDGHLAVSCSDDGTIKVWEIAGQVLLHTLEGHAGPVHDVKIMGDGWRAVSVSADHTLKVWDIERTENIELPPRHAEPVYALAFTPDGSRMISASEDKMLRLWDMDEPDRIIHHLYGHKGGVRDVAVTPDGWRAVSIASDETLRLWDLHHGTQIRLFDSFEPMTVACIAPDRRHVLVGTDRGLLQVWDLETGDEVATLKGHTAEIRAIAVSHDGQFALTGGEDRRIFIWNTEGEAYGWDHMPDTLDNADWVTALAVTADGTTALAGLADGTVCVWDIESAQIVEQWRAHGDEITALVSYDTGDGVPRMMTASVDQTLCLWEVEGGELITCFYADSAISAGAAVSDGSVFAAGESTGRVHILRPEG